MTKDTPILDIIRDAEEAADAAAANGIFVGKDFVDSFEVADFIDLCEPFADDTAHVPQDRLGLWTGAWRDRLYQLGRNRIKCGL